MNNLGGCDRAAAEIKMRLFVFLAALAFVAPALAQVDTIARRELIHLKDLAAAADKRYEQRFDAQEKAVASALAAQKELGAAALTAAKEAVIKAEQAGEKRFDSVNEFRKLVNDQQVTFATRSEMDQRFIALTREVAALQQRVDKGEGKDTGAANLWGLIAGGFGLLIGGIGIYVAVTRRGAERRAAA